MHVIIPIYIGVVTIVNVCTMKLPAYWIVVIPGNKNNDGTRIGNDIVLYSIPGTVVMDIVVFLI